MIRRWAVPRDLSNGYHKTVCIEERGIPISRYMFSDGGMHALSGLLQIV